MVKKLTQEQALAKYIDDMPKPVLPFKYINRKTPIDHICCCGKIFKISCDSIWSQHTKTCGCKTHNNNSLLEKYPHIISMWHPIYNGDYQPINFSPHSHYKAWWICECGNIFQSQIRAFVRGDRCRICGKNKRSISLVKNIIATSGSLLDNHPELCLEWDYNKNKNGPELYSSGSQSKVWWICKTCGYEWKTQIGSRTSGNGCQRCNMSKGEKETQRILEALDIEYQSEKSYDNLLGIGGGFLRFDFYLPKYNLLIEYQGEQHFINNPWYNKKSQKITLKHDKIKKEYCKKHGIKLLEINYTDYDNISSILKKELNIC